jgi:16S rRNA (uracil1498-N3)-methyltransferase
MLRLFVPAAARDGAHVRIAGAELRHLRTLRLGPGDRLIVFDDGGAEHEVVLERLGAQAADAAIVGSRRTTRESPLDLVLAPALLKGSKLDLVVEKATELGVRRIAPLLSRHTIGRGAHVERWRRIALAAAKQSARTTVPVVDAPVPLAALLAAAWPGLRLLAWEEEGSRRFDALPPAAAAVVIVVGPEGGFSSDEVEAARAAGFTTVGLGGRVLRAETAAIVAATLCQHRWGDG